MKFTLKKGDITKEKCDAIINAANSSLLGGGGVDGAIHLAAGKGLLEECRLIRQNSGECDPGKAVITKGYNLSTRFVIHTVGPIWHGGSQNEKETLKECYKNSLKLAEEKKLKTIAFPNISTGVYRFPKELAAQVVFEFFKEYSNTKTSIEEIIFICFDDENFELYEKLVSKL